jgi:hypothetical protein
VTTSSSSSSDRNPVEALADEFLRRQRGGERPTLEEYCRRHPELADEIREVFPVLIRMEDVRCGTNLEVFLAIEARRRGAGSPTWSYAAAPLTRAAPTIRLGRQDVWTHPTKVVTSPEDAHSLARKPRRP